MLKLLGTLDLCAAMYLVLLAINVPAISTLVIILAAYLIVKAVFFSIASLNVASFIDFGAGLLLLLSLILAIPAWLLAVAAAALAQKGVFSFIG